MIRSARRGDIIDLDHLSRLFGREIESNSPLNKSKSRAYKQPARIQASPMYGFLKRKGLVLVAEQDKRIIGYAAGRIIHQGDMAVRKYGRFEDLYVVKPFRRVSAAQKFPSFRRFARPTMRPLSNANARDLVGLDRSGHCDRVWGGPQRPPGRAPEEGEVSSGAAAANIVSRLFQAPRRSLPG